MAEFVNKVTLQGQLGDCFIHDCSTDDSCVMFTLKVEDSRIDCFVLRSQAPEFFRQVACSEVHTNDWIRLEGFLNIQPGIANDVICKAVAVLPE